MGKHVGNNIPVEVPHTATPTELFRLSTSMTGHDDRLLWMKMAAATEHQSEGQDVVPLRIGMLRDGSSDIAGYFWKSVAETDQWRKENNA